MAWRAPYQTTPQEATASRRRAAYMRALAGVAAKGPELGTDPFGSFQAGLRGAISQGAEQEAMDFEREKLNAATWIRDQENQIEMERAQRARDPRQYGVMPWFINPNLPPGLKELAAKAQEDAFRAPYGAKTISDRIQEFRDAYGRDPDEREQAMLSHTYTRPFHDPANPFKGPAGAIWSYGIMQGLPMGEPNNPNPEAVKQAEKLLQASGMKVGWTLEYDPFSRSMQPRYSIQGMGAEDLKKLGDASSVPGATGATIAGSVLGGADERREQTLNPPRVQPESSHSSVYQGFTNDQLADTLLSHIEQGDIQPGDQEQLLSIAGGQQPGVSQRNIQRARRIVQGLWR